MEKRICEINNCLFPEYQLTQDAVKTLVQLYTKFNTEDDDIITRLTMENELGEMLYKMKMNSSEKIPDILIEQILLSVHNISSKNWKKYTMRIDENTHISLKALNKGVKKDSSLKKLLKNKLLEEYVTE